MPQVNTDIWGAPENAYTGFNQRGGTSNINDADFTEFPPISLCTYTDVASYKQLLYQWINGGKLSLDDEIDKSICYVGMFNNELPQLNIVGLYNNTKNTLDDPLYKTDNTQIQSFFFTGITNYNEFADYLSWGASQLYTDTFTFSDYKLMRYKGGILGTAPNVSPQRNANCNSFLNVFQNFGIKSFILEINVKYKTGTDTFGVTTGMYTLKEYTEQTTAWKAEHPIVTAFCRPFWRSNKNGTYSYVKPSGYFCELMPVFTLPYKSNDSDITDNISYHINVCRTTTTRTGYFPIYGAIRQELETSATAQAVQVSGRAALLVGANRGTLNSITNGDSKAYWLELDGTNADNIEYIRRGAAAYGLFFCDDIGTLGDSGQDVTRWLDNDMMLGTIDENGLTNGDYTRGAMNATGRQFTWKTINDSDYNPSRPPVPENHYNNATVFNTIGNLATMFKRYVLSAAEVETIGKDLFKITDDLAVGSPSYDEYATEINSKFLVSNPLDCIVSLRRFPMEIPKDNNYDNIKLGTNEINTCGYGMEKTAYTYLFEMADSIYPNFGDSFLDYEPYTNYELYVPFCGTVKLSPRDIIGRKLAVQLVVDFTTGTCTGFVMSDDLVIETVNGNIAIDIPVNGISSATIAANLNNAVAQEKTSYNNTFTASMDLVKSYINPLSWAQGKPVSSTANFLNAKITNQLADYNVQHQDATPHSIGAATPCGLWAIDLNCRLICYFPTGDIISVNANQPRLNNKIYDFGAQTGFACLITDKTLGEFNGMTTAVNPLLGGQTTNNGKALTADELTLLEKALQDGIIL